MDSISYLIDLITPIVRNIPLLSMSSIERESLCHAITVMSRCSLSYVPSPSSSVSPNIKHISMMDREGGEMSLQLDPPIHELISFHMPCNTSGQTNIPIIGKKPIYDAYAEDNELQHRHALIPFEIRNVLNMELKKFLITGEVSILVTYIYIVGLFYLFILFVA